MNRLIEEINKLKNSDAGRIINQRIKEFEDIPHKFNNLFRELVFCILTAGASAELGLKTIEHLGNTIFSGNQKEIQKKLKEVYRFHTIRANYIFQARENFRKINIDSENIRDDLIKNIKGIGMKEASHFLRNIGFKDFAIIDFHIIDLLVRYGLIEKPKTLTKKKYLEIEDVLRKIAEGTNLNLAELDLYLWYMETGKILK